VEDGLYQNLVRQLQRWRRRHNRKSYKTRERYDASLNVFLRFLADHFHLQKLANIKPKHLVAFVEHRLSEGISASTIATDLSSIRLFLDSYDELRTNPEEFPNNEELRKYHDMPTRHFGGVIRAWTTDEFQVICTIAENLGRPIVAQTLGLAFWLGLRLHEVMQIDHARITNALSRGFIAIKGKGDKWRDVPLCDEAHTILLEARKRTARGDRAFVEKDRAVDIQMKSVQHFVGNHRRKIDSNRPISRKEMLLLAELEAGPMTGPLTFHGLRHSYAMRQYARCRMQGMTPLQARLQVSKWLGHERDDVTRIYMAGVTKNNDI
jgi:integrase/recombinase XerD